MISGDGGGSSLSIVHSLLEPERGKVRTRTGQEGLVLKTGLSADLCNWAASPWFHRIGSTELAMLILKPQDVEIVKILHPVTQKRIAILGYQGIFFRPIKTFDLNRRPDVLALCRKISEEHKRTCVILAEPERYSLWGKVNFDPSQAQPAIAPNPSRKSRDRPPKQSASHAAPKVSSSIGDAATDAASDATTDAVPDATTDATRKQDPSRVVKRAQAFSETLSQTLSQSLLPKALWGTGAPRDGGNGEDSDEDAIAAPIPSEATASGDERKGDRPVPRRPDSLFTAAAWDALQRAPDEKFAQEILAQLNACRHDLGAQILQIVHPSNTVQYQRTNAVFMSYRDGGGYTYGLIIFWFRYVAFGMGKNLSTKVSWEVVNRKHHHAKVAEDGSMFAPTNAQELDDFFRALLPLP